MRAFSLIELSIVLVILGLLTGGILAGKSLIRASELRAATTEAERYKTSIYAFRDKYFMLPGDINNATSIWGSAGGTGANAICNSAVSSAQAVCNGDGNGAVYQSGAINEPAMAWKEMMSAGLIEGSITKTTTCCEIGLSMPGSKLAGGGWYINTAGAGTGTYSSNATNFDGYFGLILNVASRPTNTTAYGIVTGAEAWNIDTKLDDGIPYSGKFVTNWSATLSQVGTACTSATSSADSTATYNLTADSKDCVPTWRQI
jgi:prepilin-type N-terminal cleavage/methylation domain-containing protein